MKTNYSILNAALSEINHSYQRLKANLNYRIFRVRLDAITIVLYALGYCEEVIIIRKYVNDNLNKGEKISV